MVELTEKFTRTNMFGGTYQCIKVVYGDGTIDTYCGLTLEAAYRFMYESINGVG